VTREVEAVIEQPLGKILRSRRDLDDVRRVPRPTQCNLGVGEHEIHVRGHESLAVSALFVLLDEPHDRCVAQGEFAGRICRARHARGHGAGAERRPYQGESNPEDTSG
jgi:hypothetical protein